MEFIQVIVLGLIQGITEFLPVSSSGHLVLVSILLGWEDQGLVMDIAAHAGSLLAVLFYFKKELKEITVAVFNPGAQEHAGIIQLLKAIVIATIPIVVVGFVLADYVEMYFRDARIVAITTILFALFLAYADRKSTHRYDEYQIDWKQAVFIGCTQVFALIPGASRSGVTMTAALLLGLNKVAAVRFSFLLSIPAILAAIAYKAMEVSLSAFTMDIPAVVGVFLISAVVAYVCIEAFIRFVNLIGMMPFVIYRVLLGLLLLAFA